MPEFKPNDNTQTERKARTSVETILLQLLKNWWVLLIGTLIAAMFIYVFVTENYKEKYASTATFVVTGKGSVSGTKLSDIDTAKNMAQAFAYVLDSDILMQEVKDRVGIKTFNGTVKTAQVKETNIITLTVTSDSPELSFSVINAIIESHHFVTDKMMQNATMYVLMQPTVPKSPVSPINRRNRVFVYSAAAFLLLAAAIVVKTIFSKKIYNEKDFENKVGELERLASIEREKKRRRSLKAILHGRKIGHSESLLISNPTTSFGFTETCRLLQTRVQHLMKNSDYQTLMVSSVDADEGRSTVAANLALSFARENRRVLLIEADMGEPSLAKILGCRDKLNISIDEYIFGGMSGEELPTPDGARNLSLLICRDKVKDPMSILGSHEMQRFMSEARRYFDFIIVDTPPVASSNAAEYLAELCDAAIMVVRQGFATAQRISTALGTLNENTDVLGYVLNDMRYISFFDSNNDSGVSPYGSYGKNQRNSYGKYGKYGKYGSYGGYAAELRPDEAQAPSEAPTVREGAARDQEEPAYLRVGKADEEKEIDLGQLFIGTAKAFLRIIWLPIILAIALSLAFCLKEKRSYRPKYKATATFTISAVGASGDTVQDYSKKIAQKYSKVFPHILTSGILSNMICEDLKVKSLPATLSAHVEGETTLFTLQTVSSKRESAIAVLNSAIKNCPKVSSFVLGNTNMELLRDPVAPTKPINSPNYKKQIMLGSGIALIVGLAVAVVLNMTRKTVSGTEELRKILNLRCIGTVPFDKSGKDEKSERIVNILDNKASSDFSESINLIRKRLQKTAEEHDEKVILFAGSVPGEGKSTIALNTAFALANAGKRVVFIDCDIRKPSTISSFDGVRDNGLVEYLTGNAEADEIVSKLGDNIYVIRGSTKNFNAPELLRSDRMRDLVAEMRQSADFVLIDTPPSAILADAQIIAEYVDTVVYVVCADYTMRSSLINGVNNLTNTGVRFMGYVINNAGVSETGHSYSKHSKYAKYGKYSSYGKYGRYGGYGKYGRYGGYGKYGRYGGYGKYGKYGKYGRYSHYYSKNYGNYYKTPESYEAAEQQ